MQQQILIFVTIWYGTVLQGVKRGFQYVNSCTFPWHVICNMTGDVNAYCQVDLIASLQLDVIKFIKNH